MKLTLLSRLILSYLFLFILVIALSVYAIVRIGQFNEVIQSVLMTNSRIVDSTRRLTDTSLSLIRYERKFLITKDDSLYQEFLRLKNDFDQTLIYLHSLTDSSSIKSFLEKIETSHQHYQSLFAEEVAKLRTGQTPSRSPYKDEKDRTSNAILEEIDRLRAYSQRNTDEEIQKLYEAGKEARQIAIAVTATFLFLAVAVSLFINRTFTQPLSVLKKKTGEIARGIFKGDLNLFSPPEIGELAKAVNLMCDKLNELDEMKSDFFSTMSHELRTPLASIRMGLELLKGEKGRLNEEDRKVILETALKENSRVIDLVNSLLDLSKMEAGMMTFDFKARDVAPLMNKVVEEMGPFIKTKQITLELKIAEKLPVIKMDSERMLQVLRNLIGNALKFTPAGGVVRFSASLTDGEVRVSVSDSGPGIPEEDLRTVFEKFRRLTANDSVQLKGTGLGLAIAKQIITSHGGRIWAESEPGRGSTFVFELPI